MRAGYSAYCQDARMLAKNRAFVHIYVALNPLFSWRYQILALPKGFNGLTYIPLRNLR